MTSSPPGTADATHAWELYQVTMEWVRHADAKATALLAANATLTAGLLALDKVTGLATWWTVGTLAAALASFLLAAWTVVPTLRSNGGSSLVFFDHAARNHATVSAYRSAHAHLLGDPDALVADLAGQTWNLARIARSKFVWTGYSVLAFLAAAVSAGVLAAVEVLGK